MKAVQLLCCLALAACVSRTHSQEPFAMQREAMVRTQIEARGVKDPRVLAALRRVPRERFVVAGSEARAYTDAPLSIGHGQTISQPYIVAVMSEAAMIEADEVVLEIGTGSAYQAAVLGELAREVYTIEIVPALAQRAEALLRDLGYRNVHTRLGDGYGGWPEHAPFDAIVVTAAPPAVPEALKQQLKVGGRLVVPVGTFEQELLLIERTATGFREQRLMPVRFVPMVPKKNP
jgi:protein-L-isoaspartate(D-aspartate) O-methyltransferase